MVVTERQGMVVTERQGMVVTERQGMVVTERQGMVLSRLSPLPNSRPNRKRLPRQDLPIKSAMSRGSCQPRNDGKSENYRTLKGS